MLSRQPTGRLVGVSTEEKGLCVMNVTQPRYRGSAARLGEGDEASGTRVASLHQIVAFRLDSKGFGDEGNQVLPGPEGVPEIRLKSAEEARAKESVGGEAKAIAVVAEVVAHRGDDPHRSLCTREAIVDGGPVPVGTGDRLQLIHLP